MLLNISMKTLAEKGYKWCFHLSLSIRVNDTWLYTNADDDHHNRGSHQANKLMLSMGFV